MEKVLPPVPEASATQRVEVSANAVTTRAAGFRDAVGRVTEYLLAVRDELRKITWPTRDELVKATRTIAILAIVLGLLIGWMDLLLNRILVGGVARLTQ
jgi:preprotein translocase subunit SecE